LENTGFFEQSVILTHPPPSGATSSGFTTNRLRRDKQGGKAAVFTSSLQTQVLQLHIYCSRWSQLGNADFFEQFIILTRQGYSHLLPLVLRSLARRRIFFSKKAGYFEIGEYRLF